MTSISEAVAHFIQKDHSASEDRIRRRANWSAARERIRPVLEEVATEVRNQKGAPSVYVMESQLYENYGAIQLSFGARPDGIVCRTEHTESIGTELGAALVFGQGQTGHIAVVFYPFELVLPGEKGREATYEIGEVIDPDELTEERVQALVVRFLMWARGSDEAQEAAKRLIGFVHHFPHEDL